MKRLVIMVLAAFLSLVAADARGKDLKVLYWNIQNGMWAGQEDDYDAFVKWAPLIIAVVLVLSQVGVSWK